MAAYIIIAVLFFLIGRKYQEFSDLMLARRISKMVRTSEKIASDVEQYEKAVRIDNKLSKRNQRIEKGEEDVI